MKMNIILLVFLIGLLGCDNDDDATGSLTMEFKLVYDGEPMAFYEDDTYLYPGSDMSFYLQKVNFFLSEVFLNGASGEFRDDETRFVLFETNVDDIEDARNGVHVTVQDVPARTYSALGFSIGVPPEQNSMLPSDFMSSNPLSQSSEHWPGWDSYIFTKVEGHIDTSGQGAYDKVMVLHTGGDESLRRLQFTGMGSSGIVVTEDQETRVEVVIDMKRYLGGDDNPYAILEGENNDIHRLNQMDQVIELTDNLANSFSVVATQ